MCNRESEDIEAYKYILEALLKAPVGTYTLETYLYVIDALRQARMNESRNT